MEPKSMNERIQELSEQAGINVIPRRPYIDEEPDGYLESDKDFLLNNHEVVVKLLEGDALKKFAQLIVQECGDWIVDNAGAMEHLGPSYFAKAMQQHFGVAE
jgi:hypothetical protein